MKNVLVDTNIILDLLLRRPPFYQDALRLFSLADRGKIKLYISALSIANTNYIITKATSAKTARATLLKFKIIVTVLELNDKIINLSLNDQSFTDFEDGLQYYTALEHNLSAIISRNLKDFKSAKIPVMTADQFLKL